MSDIILVWYYQSFDFNCFPFVNRMKSALIGQFRRYVQEGSQYIKALLDASGNFAKDSYVAMVLLRSFSPVLCLLTESTTFSIMRLAVRILASKRRLSMKMGRQFRQINEERYVLNPTDCSRNILTIPKKRALARRLTVGIARAMWVLWQKGACFIAKEGLRMI